MYQKIINKFLVIIAVWGLIISLATPAFAGTEYSPDDPVFDPSGTYVPPVVAEATPEAVSEAVPLEGEAEVGSAETEGVSEPLDAVITDPIDVSLEEGLEATNEETGPGSENESDITVETESETEISNDADIDNQISGSADSGNNSSDMNTGDGSVESGNADLAANIVNMANSVIDGSDSFALPIINIFSDLIGDLNFESIEAARQLFDENFDLFEIASNYLTGSDSYNQSTIDVSNEASADINNNADVDNNVNLSANSGDNSASRNTGDGSILTGDANIAANVINFLNTSVIAQNWLLGMINIFGDWDGDLVLPGFGGLGNNSGSIAASTINDTTGALSTNISDVDITDETALNIENNANIIDNIAFNANTGQNEANANTGEGNILTGMIDIIDNEMAIANNTIIGSQWWMMIINTLDGFSGAVIGSPDGSTSYVPFIDLLASNAETGYNSENISGIDISDQNTVNIDNNGNVNNDLTLSANTGRNAANENTGTGNIATGDANIMSNLINFMNNTFNVDNWMFGIVNVFGEWDGNIFLGDKTVSASTGSQQIDVTALNEMTGYGSENLSEAEINQIRRYCIENNLDYENVVNALLNTGDNAANYNTGEGYIDTGDIKIKIKKFILGNMVVISKKIQEEEIIPEYGGGEEELPFEEEIVEMGEFLPEAGGEALFTLLIIIGFGIAVTRVARHKIF